MELELIRACYPRGSNGTLYAGERLICYTIELPWKDNRKLVSCIPEGRYEMKKRYTPKRGWHLLIVGVPGRSGILFHPANDALLELKGCIAPVCSVTGEGKGLLSINAMERLKAVTYKALASEAVFLTIKNQCL